MARHDRKPAAASKADTKRQRKLKKLDEQIANFERMVGNERQRRKALEVSLEGKKRQRKRYDPIKQASDYNNLTVDIERVEKEIKAITRAEKRYNRKLTRLRSRLTNLR